MQYDTHNHPTTTIRHPWRLDSNTTYYLQERTSMNPTQANRAYLKMKRKLMQRMGYSSIDIPTLRNVHPEFMYAKQRLINATKEKLA